MLDEHFAQPIAYWQPYVRDQFLLIEQIFVLGNDIGFPNSFEDVANHREKIDP